MARKKTTPAEEQDLLEQEGIGQTPAEESEPVIETPSGVDGEPFPEDSAVSEPFTPPSSDWPNGETVEVFLPAVPAEEQERMGAENEDGLPDALAVPEGGGEPATEAVSVDLTAPADPPSDGAPVGGEPSMEVDPAFGSDEVPSEDPPGPDTAPTEGRLDRESSVPEKSGRQTFYDLNFNKLDRNLTAEERQEWNSIYASFRGRSALTGTIIGVDPLSVSVRNRQTGAMERQTMYCAIVIPYRVRIVIPASEMWETGQERPDFVLQNMVGSKVDFIITQVDRESGFAVASRRQATRSQRYFFSRRAALHRDGAQLTCRVLSVGPRRCLVECYGHDINLTQRELRYTAIPDLRNEYHPGQELDCIVKNYDPEKNALTISVKETESNPFDGAEQRHPVGSRRQAVIAGKYGGGVFCNLPDGTVCMCSYSYQHEDSDFLVGDTVILVVQRYETAKRQMYGKILTKW